MFCSSAQIRYLPGPQNSAEKCIKLVLVIWTYPLPIKIEIGLEIGGHQQHIIGVIWTRWLDPKQSSCVTISAPFVQWLQTLFVLKAGY